MEYISQSLGDKQERIKRWEREMTAKQKKILLICAGAVYLSLQTVLGVLVQLTEGRTLVIISYACIVINAVFAIFLNTGRASATLTHAGLLFTLFADYFLVYSENKLMLPAMVFFNLTQLCYGARLLLLAEDKKQRIVQLALRGAVMTLGALLPVIVLGSDADALAIISIMYFANLLLNAGIAVSAFRRSPFLAVGLLLFIGCDIFVGFGALHMYLPITEGTFAYFLAYPPFNAAWLFYVPSQALITLSMLRPKLDSIK